MKQNDLNNTILTQYTLSEKIRLLIDTFNSSIASEANIEEFYNKVFNITTADSYGLDVWGEIVGLSRYIDVKESGSYLGFNESKTSISSNIKGFNQAPFYSGKSDSKNYRMGDEMYRSLILIKALANISQSTVADISKSLNMFFKDKGAVIVKDNLNMTMRYHFDFAADKFDFAVIRQLIKFIRPSGVLIDATAYKSKKMFGFKGSQRATFGHGIFYSDAFKI